MIRSRLAVPDHENIPPLTLGAARCRSFEPDFRKFLEASSPDGIGSPFSLCTVMSVPETAVNEDSFFAADEGDVRLSRQVFPMKPVPSEPDLPQRTPNDQLGRYSSSELRAYSRCGAQERAYPWFNKRRPWAEVFLVFRQERQPLLKADEPTVINMLNYTSAEWVRGRCSPGISPYAARTASVLMWTT